MDYSKGHQRSRGDKTVHRSRNNNEVKQEVEVFWGRNYSVSIDDCFEIRRDIMLGDDALVKSVKEKYDRCGEQKLLVTLRLGGRNGNYYERK